MELVFLSEYRPQAGGFQNKVLVCSLLFDDRGKVYIVILCQSKGHLSSDKVGQITNPFNTLANFEFSEWIVLDFYRNRIWRARRHINTFKIITIHFYDTICPNSEWYQT